MRPGLVWTFAAMGAVTYLTRAPFLLVLAHRRPPAGLARYFTALPIALLTALAVPLVVRAEAGVPAAWNAQLPAAIVVALLARWTGNLLISVGAGALIVALLRTLGLG